MCGRYIIDKADMDDIFARLDDPSGLSVRQSGEIFPTDIVPIQTGINQYQPMKWEFSGFNGIPLINARSKTALTLPTFRTPMANSRCLVRRSS
jgi:putative SOS response-associated peptidase YedK